MNTSILILFISYFPPLYSSFHSLAMLLILIFFICNKEPDDAFGTHKVIYYLKIHQGNYSLFTFGANYSVRSTALQFVFRNCLLASVYLAVWPTNFIFAHLLDSNELAHTSVALALSNTDVGIVHCILLLISLLRYC